MEKGPRSRCVPGEDEVEVVEVDINGVQSEIDQIDVGGNVLVSNIEIQGASYDFLVKGEIPLRHLIAGRFGGDTNRRKAPRRNDADVRGGR